MRLGGRPTRGPTRCWRFIGRYQSVIITKVVVPPDVLERDPLPLPPLPGHPARLVVPTTPERQGKRQPAPPDHLPEPIGDHAEGNHHDAQTEDPALSGRPGGGRATDRRCSPRD